MFLEGEAKLQEAEKMEDRDLLIIGGAVLLVLLLFGGGMGFGMGFGMIFWFLLLIAIVYIGVSLADRGKLTKEKTAREILDERYARGEITSEEYKRMKENLR